MSTKVRVEGLRELRSALRALDATLPRELRAVNKRVVEQVILPEARRRAQQTRTNIAGGPARLGSKGLATLRALATQGRAQVALGSARVPWAAGQEWGSTGKNAKARMFPRAAEHGLILYPVVREKQAEIIDAYTEMLDKLTRRAFPE